MTTNVLIPVSYIQRKVNQNGTHILNTLDHCWTFFFIELLQYCTCAIYTLYYILQRIQGFGKLSVLLKLRKRIHVVTFLYLWLLTCIYCVGWVRLGSTIRWRRCAPCMDDTRMRFAREKRQHYMYLCMIMWTPWKFF